MSTRTLKAVLVLVMTLPSAVHAEAFRQDALSSEQRRVVDEARGRYKQDWRVLNKVVDGRVRTVLLLGETYDVDAGETLFTKNLVDQFQHFGIENPNVRYYDSSEDSFRWLQRPHAELAPVGRNTKSLHDIKRFHRRTFGERVEVGSTVILGLAAGLVGIAAEGPNYFDQATPLVLGAGLVVAGGWLIHHLARYQLPKRKNEVRAMAKFANEWIQAKSPDKILVIIVNRQHLKRLVKVLETTYAFEAS